MPNRTSLAAVSGFFAVGLGAFGAHGLRLQLQAAGTLATWQTAVLYHFVHTLAILAVARTGSSPRAERWLQRAATTWAIGIVLFSGSLYALALGSPPPAGYITPFGGVAFLAGWVMLFFARPAVGDAAE